MTIEEVKEELKEYKENIKYIREKQEDVIDTKSLITKTTSFLDTNKTTGGKNNYDKIGNGLSRLEDLGNVISDRVTELLLKKFIIDEKIDKMKYPHRDVLFYRYARSKSWREISKELGYDENYVRGELHGEALKKYANL